MVTLIIIGVVAFLIVLFLKRFKSIKVGSLTMVTGGVKCGKSTLSVYLAIREHKRAVRSTKIFNFFQRLRGKSDKQLELPLLYSNIPLDYPYSPLTDDLLLRKSRFVYGSIIYVCESSLVADSQLIKDKDLNTRMLLFNKLIGHETKGGKLIYDTQSISDVHYSIKRSLSDYFYIHHLHKGLFFMTAYVQENRYSEDGSVITTNNDDVEDNLKKVLIPKRTWKYFDCYCYSSMTDDLPVSSNVIEETDSLKANKILSFRPEIENYCEVNKNDKKD